MKRYHVDPSHYRASLTYEDDNGAWVRWEDTESLREENARLLMQVDIAEKWKALALSYLLRECPHDHECLEEDKQNCITCWDEHLLEELAGIVWKTTPEKT